MTGKRFFLTPESESKQGKSSPCLHSEIPKAEEMNVRKKVSRTLRNPLTSWLLRNFEDGLVLVAS